MGHICTINWAVYEFLLGYSYSLCFYYFELFHVIKSNVCKYGIKKKLKGVQNHGYFNVWFKLQRSLCACLGTAGNNGFVDTKANYCVCVYNKGNYCACVDALGKYSAY